MRSAALVSGYETYISTKPLSAHTLISSASAMPSQRWTRNAMRRAQRVARVKREKRGAARGAGERPAPALGLEAEAVADMERHRRPAEAGHVGDIGHVGTGAGDRGIVVGVERVLQADADAVPPVRIDE